MSRKTKKRNKNVFDRMPLTKRITFFYGIMFAIAILVICGVVALNAAVIFEDQVKMQLTNTVDNIKRVADQKNVSDINIDNYLGDKYVEVIIKDIDTGAIYSNETGETPEFIQNINAMGDFNEFAGRETFYDFKPFTSIINPETDISGRVMVSLDTCENESGRYLIVAYKYFKNNFAYVKKFVIEMLVFGGIAIYIMFVIGRYIARRILDPVAEVTKTASRMSAENLSQRIEAPETKDEIRELCLTFNSMMDRLEESFKKQERFVADASHELRTPIAVIQGYAKLLDRWGKHDDVVLQESIDSIITETQHMSTMVRNLLFMAKSDQNRIEINKEVISLNEIARSVVEDANMLESGKNITFTDDEQAYIFADSNLIRQLLNIYMENSLKYTEDNGEINVRVWRENEYSCVSVKDNGCGIEKEKIPYIFDRFYKADESRTGRVSGTGIGLSIAKWIADIHDGSISVESEVGKGTEFTTKFIFVE
ncbi:MAG: HAMP domain-containing protein [Firmicutes bacterium]|nr:HAMP domain-containing protein [Bacillota bacterium]